MGRFACVLAALVACGDADPPPAAAGALRLDLEDRSATADAIAATIATEIEVLRSRELAELVVRRLGLHRAPPDRRMQANEVRRAIRASRRGESLVIDVGVIVADPHQALEICNATLEQYVERRMAMRLQELDAQIIALAQAEEATGTHSPEREALERQRQTRRNDARVLDRCEIIELARNALGARLPAGVAPEVGSRGTSWPRALERGARARRPGRRCAPSTRWDLHPTAEHHHLFGEITERGLGDLEARARLLCKRTEVGPQRDLLPTHAPDVVADLLQDPDRHVAGLHSPKSARPIACRQERGLLCC